MKYWLYILVVFFGCKGVNNSITLVHNVGFAQGTSYSIKYMASDNQDFHHQIDSIFAEIDNSLSTYIPQSLISQLNTGDTSLILDTHFVRVFKAAQQLSNLSSGLFDCTVNPLVDAWGFGENQKKDLDSIAIIELLNKVGYREVYLKGDSLISNPLLRTLNFNAIAQGYTVDVIAEYLNAQSVTDYLIEVGGELRSKGLNSRNKSWRVGIDKPSNEIDKNDRFQIVINLNNKSLATSGNYRKYYEKDGQIYSHTINPKTAYPVQHSLLSATVIADDCMMADAYATTFMVMGVEQTQEFLKSHPELEVFLIYTDEDNQWKNWFTDGFKSLVIN
ncbi:FAD:protein FMN transferase [Flavobacteriales bacterium]|nr:FAD:protein FMN transferase [Flavobacteriales bacterium]